MTEGYGQRFGERLRVENARAMATRVLQQRRVFNRIVDKSPSAWRRALKE
jgi:hypothetical protein